VRWGGGELAEPGFQQAQGAAHRAGRGKQAHEPLVEVLVVRVVAERGLRRGEAWPGLAVRGFRRWLSRRPARGGGRSRRRARPRCQATGGGSSAPADHLRRLPVLPRRSSRPQRSHGSRSLTSTCVPCIPPCGSARNCWWCPPGRRTSGRSTPSAAASPIATRHDRVRGDILEPFPDTWFGQEHQQRTMSRLQSAGIGPQQVTELRARFGAAMLMHNCAIPYGSGSTSARSTSSRPPTPTAPNRTGQSAPTRCGMPPAIVA
jgi:hypothetical protein